MNIVEEMFNGIEGLDEKIIQKAQTLVEAYIAEQVNAGIAAKESDQLKTLSEQFDASKSEYLTETEQKVSDFMDEVIKEWATENAVAIDDKIQVGIARDFITGMTSMFEAANVKVPSADDAQAIQTLQTQLTESEATKAELQTKLDEAQAQVLGHAREKVLVEATAGLATTQGDRVRKLAENFDSKDIDAFKEKVGILVEAFADKKKPETKPDDMADNSVKPTTQDKLNESTGNAYKDRLFAGLDALNAKNSKK